jgi:hypothetical protein
MLAIIVIFVLQFQESTIHAGGMLSLYTAVLSTTANATIRMVQNPAPIS